MVRGAVSDLMILSALHMVMVPLSEPPMISPLGWVPYALHTNLWNLNAHVWVGMEESMVEQCKLLVSQIGHYSWHCIDGHFVCVYYTV